ncbi:MAG: WhiB family transcriptional regulator [Acidimicrobiales bacterium]
MREPCLAEALAAGEAWGVWGGLTPVERRRLRRRQRGEAA